MGRRSDHSRDELFEMALQAARDIVHEAGLEGLTIRGIASRIGYSHGTLYNLFDDLDAMVLQLNVRTLNALYDRLADVPLEGNPEETLLALTHRYFEFVRDNAKLWNLLFEHHLPNYEPLPDWHHAKIGQLLDLVEGCIAPLFEPDQGDEKRHAAHVIWSSLHGMTSLESQRKLIPGITIEAMAESLVKNYLAGIRSYAVQ